MLPDDPGGDEIGKAEGEDDRVDDSVGHARDKYEEEGAIVPEEGGPGITRTLGISHQLMVAHLPQRIEGDI